MSRLSRIPALTKIFDFDVKQTKAINPKMFFSRPMAFGFFNRDSVWASSPVDTPRIGKDNYLKDSLGLLVEGGYVNAAIDAHAFNIGVAADKQWGDDNVHVGIGNGYLDVINNNNAFRHGVSYSKSAAHCGFYYRRTGTFSANGPMHSSIYVRKATGKARITFSMYADIPGFYTSVCSFTTDLVTPVITKNYSAIPVKGDWWRIDMYGTAPANIANGSGFFGVWHLPRSEEPTVTDYIDVCIPSFGPNLGRNTPWYASGSNTTTVAETAYFDLPGILSQDIVISAKFIDNDVCSTPIMFSSGLADYGASTAIATDGVSAFIHSGGMQMTTSVPKAPRGSMKKVVASFSKDKTKQFLIIDDGDISYPNGNVGSTAYDTMRYLRLGSNNTSSAAGSSVFESVKIWNGTVTAEQLKAFSKML